MYFPPHFVAPEKEQYRIITPSDTIINSYFIVFAKPRIRGAKKHIFVLLSITPIKEKIAVIKNSALIKAAPLLFPFPPITFSFHVYNALTIKQKRLPSNLQSTYIFNAFLHFYSLPLPNEITASLLPCSFAPETNRKEELNKLRFALHIGLKR